MKFIENWFFILKGVFEMVAEELGWEFHSRHHWDMDEPDACA